MGLLGDVPEQWQPPKPKRYERQTAITQQKRDEELNNLDRPELTEDFSDSPFSESFMPETLNLSGALDLFSDHLPDIRKACVENTLDIQAKHSPYQPLGDDDEVTVDSIRQHIRWLQVEELTRHYIRTIKRIDSRNQHHKKGITDEDIARAKEVPLAELYEGKLFGRKRQYGLCPFHGERSPSFYIFPDNRFKCFGCQVHGTPIDYVMLRDGVSFLKAVKTLCGL